MAKKLILTEEQHTVIINEILRETVQNIETIEADGNLNEGIWDSVKYGLSKLGRYKANGKIFGKGKIDQEAARKIQQIIDKEGNELIKNLDAKIREENPEFPNSKDPQQFLTSVMEIAAIYDSIVAGTQKSPEQPGYMPIDAANGIITDLREYTKKFLDTDLAAVYSGFDENENKLGDNNLMSEEYELDENQVNQIDEYFGLNEAPNQLQARNNNQQVPATNTQNPQVSGKANSGNYQPSNDVEDVDYEDVADDTTQNPNLDAKDVRAGLKGKRGDGAEFDSTRMDTLKSNKLPMTLVGIGASLGAFSWLVNTEWFKHLFDVVTKNPSIEYIKQAVQEKTDVFASIKPHEGMTQIMNRLNGLNLNPNSSPEDFINGIKTLGGGNVNEGIKALAQQGGIFHDPEAARKVLTEIVNNPDAHGSNLGEIFQNKWAGTGKSLGDALVTQTGGGLKGIVINTIIKAVPKLVIKTGVKAGAGYALAQGFGAILGPIGLGLVTAGALVKLVRMKGQKSSRAATLNALYQSMRGLEGGVGVVPPPIGAETATGTSDDTTGPEIVPGNGENPTATGNTGGEISARTGSQTGNGIGNISGIGGGDSSNTGNGGNATGAGNGAAKGLGTGNGGNAAANTPAEQNAVNDEVYNDLKNLFQFIVNNKKTMGDKTEFNTGTNGAPLNEGKFINDKNVIQYLTKTLGADKVKNFETLLTRIEYLRNVLKKMAGRTTDSNINNFLKQLNSNPIMLTKFAYITEVDPRDPQDVKELSSFINEVLLAIYSGNYKFGNMVDKMATLGGGNINKVNEGAGYNATEPNEDFVDDANSRGTFKKNLVNFLTTVMGLFQYLHKAKGGEIARQDTSQKYTPQQRTNGPRQQEPQPDENGQYGLDLKENIKLQEELKRIKKIMLS